MDHFTNGIDQQEKPTSTVLIEQVCTQEQNKLRVKRKWYDDCQYIVKKKSSRKFNWTAHEDKILRDNLKYGFAEVSSKLSEAGFDRTTHACESRCCRLRCKSMLQVPNFLSHSIVSDVIPESSSAKSITAIQAISKESSSLVLFEPNPSTTLTNLPLSSTVNNNSGQKCEIGVSSSVCSETRFESHSAPIGLSRAMKKLNNNWSDDEVYILFHAFFVDGVPTFEGISERLEVLGYYRTGASCRQKVRGLWNKRDLEKYVLAHPDLEVMDSSNRPVRLSTLSELMQSRQLAPAVPTLEVMQSIETSPQIDRGMLNPIEIGSDPMFVSDSASVNPIRTTERVHSISANLEPGLQFFQSENHSVKYEDVSSYELHNAMPILDSYFNNTETGISHRMEPLEFFEMGPDQDTSNSTIDQTQACPPSYHNTRKLQKISPKWNDFQCHLPQIKTSNSSEAGRSLVKWTEHEYSILREYYPKGIIAVCNKLTEEGFHRSQGACSSKYWRLKDGVKNVTQSLNSTGDVAEVSTNSWLLWSTEEENLLLQWLQNNHKDLCYYTASKVLEDAGFSRSPVACYSKVNELKKVSDPAVLAIVSDIPANYGAIRQKFTAELRNSSLSYSGVITSSMTLKNSSSAVSNPAVSSSTTMSSNADEKSQLRNAPRLKETHQPVTPASWTIHEIYIVFHAIYMDGVSIFETISKRLAMLGYQRNPYSCMQKYNGVRKKGEFKDFIMNHPDLEVMDSSNRPVRLSSLSEKMRSKEHPDHSSIVLRSTVEADADKIINEQLESNHQGFLDPMIVHCSPSMDPTLAPVPITENSIEFASEPDRHHNTESMENNFNHPETDEHQSIESMENNSSDPEPDEQQNTELMNAGSMMEINSSYPEPDEHQNTESIENNSSKTKPDKHHNKESMEFNAEPDKNHNIVPDSLSTKDCCRLECGAIVNDTTNHPSGVLHLQIHECPPDCQSHSNAQKRCPLVDGTLMIDAVILIQLIERFSSVMENLKNRIYETAN